MKRFWLVLLSLGLVLALSAPAMAVDVKFGGSFYAAGVYQDKTNVMKDSGSDGASTAYYYQRLRVQTDFIVSPGLSLVTRFDAMERAWGAPRATANLGNQNVTLGALSNSDIYSAGTTAENENIAFDYAYIQYISPIGMFRVGYMGDGTWGTPFGDYDLPVGKIMYANQFGPVTAIGYIAKFKDSSYTSKNPVSGYTDRDVDMYCLAAQYAWKGGEAGLLYKLYRNAGTRGSNFTQIEHFLLPYAKAKIGPVFIQAELIYGFGDYMTTESGVGNMNLNTINGWIDATADFGMFYFGGSFAYLSGDDPTTPDKKEGGVVTGGADWNPALILFNYDRYYWNNGFTGWTGTSNPNQNDNPYLATSNAGMSNAYFFQGRAGLRPIAKLDIQAAVSYAAADKKYMPLYGIPVTGGTYGTEIDLTGTYKITNNLSYMLGVGYLFTGDYFKGSNAAGTNNVKDNYLALQSVAVPCTDTHSGSQKTA